MALGDRMKRDEVNLDNIDFGRHLTTSKQDTARSTCIIVDVYSISGCEIMANLIMYESPTHYYL